MLFRSGLNPLIRHQILAQEYAQMGKWEDVIHEVEQIQTLRPGNNESQSNLFYLYEAAGNAAFVQLGNLEKAEEMFQQALLLNPHHPQIRKTLELVQAVKKEAAVLTMDKGDQ